MDRRSKRRHNKRGAATVRIPRKIRKLSNKKQVSFLRSLLSLVKSNMTQKEIAINLYEYGAAQEKIMGYLALEGLEEGISFTRSAKPFFDTMAWEAMLAGETMNNWTKGILNALKVLEVNGKVGAGMFLVLLRPIGLLVFMAIASVVASNQFFPTIKDIYPINRWDTLSVFAYEIGVFFTNWGLFILGVIAAISVGIYFTLIYFIGNSRISLDKLPIFRQYRLVLGSNLLRSIGNLSLAGFGIKESIQSVLKTSNKYQAWHLEKALRNISDGKQNIGNIFDTGLLQPSEQSTLKVLGGKGKYGEVLLNCSEITQNNLIKESELVKTWGGNILTFLGSSLALIIMAGIGLVMFGIAINVTP